MSPARPGRSQLWPWRCPALPGAFIAGKKERVITPKGPPMLARIVAHEWRDWTLLHVEIVLASSRRAMQGQKRSCKGLPCLSLVIASDYANHRNLYRSAAKVLVETRLFHEKSSSPRKIPDAPAANSQTRDHWRPCHRLRTFVLSERIPLTDLVPPSRSTIQRSSQCEGWGQPPGTRIWRR